MDCLFLEKGVLWVFKSYCSGPQGKALFIAPILKSYILGVKRVFWDSNMSPRSLLSCLSLLFQESSDLGIQI